MTKPLDVDIAHSVPGQVTESLRWRRSYARRLFATDLAVVVLSVLGAQLLWFGPTSRSLKVPSDFQSLTLNYTVISLLVAVAWMISLGLSGSREYRVIGVGNTEYKRVLDASFRLFGVFAIITFLFAIDIGRGYILTAFPAGLLALVVTRSMWRRWLHRKRADGMFSARVLLVGSDVTVKHIADQLARQPHAGYHVVAACTPNAADLDFIPGTSVPIIGSVDRVGDALGVSGADTVIITSSDELPPDKIRSLSWELEPGRQHLVVAPSLTDIGGPRIHTRPVAGLPLIHVETPQFVGRKNAAKRVFDILGSGALILVLGPLMVGLAVAVKATSPGPIFYRQERIGLNGKAFGMLKFRSMIVNADDQLMALLEAQGTSDTPLFKVTNDPRITPIGRVIRKYSLDEVPQIFNVFLGEMSLVGPRPQREPEVAMYDKAAARRLFVKPGMSGLWQVSGRSDLSWEDAIRLDLYYVENWSLAGDLAILWKTGKAVVSPGGAY